MDWIDGILNVACLLLWLGWAAGRFDPLGRPTPSSLAGTLRRASPSSLRRWSLLGAVPVLVLVRGFFYWFLGPSLGWTPAVDLGVTVLPFRSDYWERAQVFSAVSFARILAMLYVWLLLLAMLSHRRRDNDAFARLVSLLLWPLGRWPWLAQLFAGPAILALGWLALHPLLAWCQAVPAGAPVGRVLLQGVFIWAWLLLAAKYLLAVILIGHLIHSYVYLGQQQIWSFFSATAKTVLWPLSFLPLRVGRVDFAPVVGVALVFLLANLAGHWLARFYPL
jgi:hypothetical protein